MVDGDLFLDHACEQRGWVFLFEVHRIQGRSIQQSAEYIHDRGIETIGGNQCQPVITVEMQAVGIIGYVMQDIALVLHHSFGLSR